MTCYPLPHQEKGPTTLITRGLLFWACLLLVLGACVDSTNCNCPSYRMADIVAPAPGSKDVPVDALVWIAPGIGIYNGQTKAVTVQVLSPAGSVAGATESLETDITGMSVRFFRPAHMLDPWVVYTVSVNGSPVSSFTTGSQLAGPPPAVPSVSVTIERFPPGECYSESAEVSLSQPGLFVIAQVKGEESAFQAQSMSGRVAQVLSSPSASFFVGACGYNWPSTARFGSVDIAGQFSGWTNWKAIR